MNSQLEGVIQAPLAAVYDALADPSGFPSWSSEVIEAAALSPGVYRLKVMDVPPAHQVLVIELEPVEPPYVLAWHSLDHPEANFESQGRIRLSRLESGTRYVIEVGSEPKGALAKAGYLVVGEPDKILRGFLAELKDYLEQA